MLEQSDASVNVAVYTLRNASDQTRLDVRKELTDLLTRIAEASEEMQRAGNAVSGSTAPTYEQLVAQGTVYVNRLSYLAQQAITLITRWPSIYVSINDLAMVSLVLADTNLYVDDAKALCQRAIKVAKSSPSRADKVLAYRINGAYYFFIGHIEEGRSYYDQATKVPIKVPGSVVRDAELSRKVDTLCLWAMSEFRTGFPREAAAHQMDARSSAQEIKDPIFKAYAAASFRRLEQQLQLAAAMDNAASPGEGQPQAVQLPQSTLGQSWLQGAQ